MNLLIVSSFSVISINTTLNNLLLSSRKMGLNCVAQSLSIWNVTKYNLMSSSRWFHQLEPPLSLPEEVMQVAVAPSLTKAAGYIFDSDNFFKSGDLPWSHNANLFCWGCCISFWSRECKWQNWCSLLGQSLCLCLHLPSQAAHCIPSAFWVHYIHGGHIPLFSLPWSQPWPPLTQRLSFHHPLCPFHT